jgi:hypothetical protein
VADLTKGTGREARNANKLGGFPTFVQECDVPFAWPLFQLEAQEPFNANFGDIGAGHLLVSASGDLRFFWASH